MVYGEAYICLLTIKEPKSRGFREEAPHLKGRASGKSIKPYNS